MKTGGGRSELLVTIDPSVFFPKRSDAFPQQLNVEHH